MKALVAITCVLLLIRHVISQCPRECICFTFDPAGTQYAVDCRAKNLGFIPAGLPRNTVHLDVGDNAIKAVRATDLAGLTQLLYLHLQNNKIASIEIGSFKNLNSLQVLNMYDNNIEQFQNGTFEGLTSLRQLEVYNTGVRTIEIGAFDPLLGCTIMNLDDNKLTNLKSGTFRNLPLLTRLSIRDNQIEVVHSKAFDNLSRLSYVHFGGNRIRNILSEAFNSLPSLRVIFFDGNDFSCDCDAIWLWEWMKTRPNLGIGPRCSRPKALDEFHIVHLQDENLLCPTPEVRIEKSKKFVFTGDTLKLTCDTSGLSQPSWHWSRNGRLVSSRKGYVKEENTLIIPNITIDHQGSYYCAAGNSEGVASNGIDVFLSGIGLRQPSFDREDSTPILQQHFVGENVKLPCDPRIDSNEDLEHIWERADALPIPPRHTITFSNELMLINIMSSDEGVYQCTVRNILGSDTIQYQLEVEIPIANLSPKIDKSNGSLAVTFARGDRGEINCFVMSDSDFTVDWFYNGWPIREAFFGTEYELINDGQTLVILNADSADKGEYMCIARNEAGVDQLIANVDVTLVPYFSRQPEDLGVPPTKAAQFYCSAAGNPKPDIRWFFISNKTGIEREVTSSGEVFVNDERLIILHSRSSDEGYYYCTATSRLGLLTSRRAFLTVYSIPSFDRANLPTEVIVEELNRVEIPCTANGRPPPVVSWIKDGNVVSTEGGRRVTNVQGPGIGTLVIENAAPDDQGTYVCRVANAAGEQFHSVELSVLRQPVLEVRPARLLSVVGETVRLHCLVSGEPPPERTWLYKGRPIEGGDRIFIVKDGSLVITNLKPWDEGYYSCLARNRIGQSEKNSLLEVSGFFGNASAPVISDKFITKPEVISRNVNEEITFICQAEGVPEPIIEWQKDGTTLDNGIRIRIDSTAGILKIFQVQEMDRGLYQCVATNSEGVDTRSFMLITRVKPEVILPPITPHIEPGSNFTLNCDAQGVPPPDIIWLLNNMEIFEEDDDFIIEANELTIYIAGAQHSGEYTCLAKNVAGEASHSIKVTVTESDEPQITVKPVSQIVFQGESFFLDCASKGTPEIMRRWYKDGVEVVPSGNIIIENYFGGVQSLIVQVAAIEDSGKYSCFVWNNFGTAESEVEILVTANEDCVTPETSPITGPMGFPDVNRTIDSRPESGSPSTAIGEPQYFDDNVVALNGQTVIINCTNEVESDTDLFHYWRHNDSDISESTSRFQDLRNGTLRLLRVKKEDSGKYECIFSFEGNIRAQVYNVIVKNRDESLGETVLTVTPLVQTVIEGSTAVLTCTAVIGQIVAVPEWFKNDVKISDNGALVIPSVTLLDSGKYECRLNGVVQKADLIVHVVPYLIVKPKDTTLDLSLNVSEVVFECEAGGLPQPTLAWTKGNQTVGELVESYQIMDNGKRLILFAPFNESDAGRYTCTASNPAGFIEASAYLTVTSFGSGTCSARQCELKSRRTFIIVGNCISVAEHTEHYCEGYCQSSIYPTYLSADNTQLCCSPGPDKSREILIMFCSEESRVVNRAVETEVINSCQCRSC